MQRRLFNNMQICAINSGYWDTKVYNGRQLFKFRTKMDLAAHSIINSTNTAKVSYEGQEYIIGDGAEKYCLDYDKTNNLLHKMVTYYSLSRLTDVRDEFKVMVALPLNLYSTLKGAYEKYLSTLDYTPITVDGVKRYIYLKECKIFPECVAALYANDPQKYRDDVVGILDIGSLTVNGCIMHNLNLVRESIFTINAGTTILCNKLRKELNGKYLINLREYQMQNIVKHGQKGVDSELIKETISTHLQEIILEMRKNNWPVESLKILLTGGGSLLMEEYLRELLPGSFLGNDCVYDNVKGLYEIAKVVFA